MPSAVEVFGQQLTDQERELVGGLGSPVGVQTFLDGIPYTAEPVYRCPLSVLRDRLANCFDGALFAAAMLRHLGDPPLILDMLPNARDDDHLLALYRRGGLWGAVAKSNFVGLRFREPIHRTLRELVLSYFEQYYNVNREKTLRGYTVPLNLARLDRLCWMSSNEHLEVVAQRLDRLRVVRLVTPAMEVGLAPVDERTYRAGLMDANEAGLYKLTAQ